MWQRRQRIAIVLHFFFSSHQISYNLAYDMHIGARPPASYAHRFMLRKCLQSNLPPANFKIRIATFLFSIYFGHFGESNNILRALDFFSDIIWLHPEFRVSYIVSVYRSSSGKLKNIGNVISIFRWTECAANFCLRRINF